MKVEYPSALLVQWFHHKTHVLSKGDESSWQDYTNYAVQSATTKRTFVATEKTNMVIKSINAGSAGINGRRMPQRGKWAALGQRNTLSALFAGKQCMCITIESTTSTTPAQARNAATRFLCQSLQRSRLRLCPNSLERRILSGCAIRSM